STICDLTVSAPGVIQETSVRSDASGKCPGISLTLPASTPPGHYTASVDRRYPLVTWTQWSFDVIQADSPRDTTPPAPPAYWVPRVDQTTVRLEWFQATDNVATVGYRVYLDGVEVAETTGTSYLIGGLTCGTTYAVAIEAFDGAGNRSAPATFNAT